MMVGSIAWRLNIPDLLGLASAGLDDMDVDARGNVYIGDSVNGRVYKFRPEGTLETTYSVIRPSPIEGEEQGMNLAVGVDSSIYIADPANELVVRYNETGEYVGAFPVPGILSLCRGADDTIYTFGSDPDNQCIQRYDQLGGLLDTLPVPPGCTCHLDSELVNLDADVEGSVYLSCGMPPYRVWRISDGAVRVDEMTRSIDAMEDAVLISDLAYDASSNVLWVLLGVRTFGQQVLDAFRPDGTHLGSMALPTLENLFNVLCAGRSGELYLLGSSSGPGAGDLAMLQQPAISHQPH